jgi:hypothetical protein
VPWILADDGGRSGPVPPRTALADAALDAYRPPTDQKVGSSNLSGCATVSWPQQPESRSEARDINLAAVRFSRSTRCPYSSLVIAKPRVPLRHASQRTSTG